MNKEIFINKYRVRASVYPTTEIMKFLCLKLLQVQGNRIIFTEHGVRQVAFPYILFNQMKLINLSFVDRRFK